MSSNVYFAFMGALVSLAACTDEPLMAPKMFGQITFQNWAQQEQATNVQDWHRMANKIADELQTRNLLATPIYVTSSQNTLFISELGQALKAEILRRQGLVAASRNRANVVDLGVNVVIWGSRVRSDPFRVRSEAVWRATVNSGDRVIMTVQEPFYIFRSDLPKYVEVPETPNPSLQLARIARPLIYAP